MKKIIFALAAILVCLSANAQKFGINAGYNRGFDYYKTAVSEKWVVDEVRSNGGFLSFSAEFPREGVVGFLTGLTFSCDGSSKELLGSKLTYTNYSLSLPVDVKFNCKFSETVGGFIYGGLTGSLGLAANYTVATTTATPVSTTVDLYKESYYNRFILGFNAGLGLDIAKHFRIFGEYGQSLTNLINTESIENDGVVKAKFGYISVGIGYIF